MTRTEKVKKMDMLWKRERERKRSMKRKTMNDQTRGDMWMSAFFMNTRRATLQAMRVHVNKDEIWCKCARKKRGVRVF